MAPVTIAPGSGLDEVLAELLVAVSELSAQLALVVVLLGGNSVPRPPSPVLKDAG